jgi:predicted enzyme related to lactoylglutathione lyase
MPRPVHFDITADDPERAVAFYEKVFGWKLNHWEGGGPMDYWLIETGPDSEPGINGGLSRREEGHSPATTNTISVDSLDDAMAAVKQAGGEILQDRMAIPGVGWFAAFADTEGNHFGLMQPEESAA